MHITNLNFHTFTSCPFILTQRSTFSLALHQFYSKLSSTTSPHHSPTLLSHKRPNSTLFPSTLQNSQNTHFFQPPIPLPLPNLRYPPSNTHSTITTHLLPITKPPISQSLTLSHKPTTPFLSHSPFHLCLSPKRKENTTHTPLPAFHHSSQFKRKQSNASLQPHDSQTVGGVTLELRLAPFALM